MKKVLASLAIAAIIIGGAVTYTKAHPEKQVTTVVNQTSNIENNIDSTDTVTNVNPEDEHININDILGDWRTTSLIGSVNATNSVGKNQSANINMTKESFKVSTTVSNNVVDSINVSKPVYKIQKLPDNYFHISFQREPETLGLASKDNYQIIVNNTPTDIYISNGKLIYNSAGSFFNLSK